MPSDSLPSPRVSVPTYDGSVTVDPVNRSINAEFRISFRRTPRTSDSVSFLLNPSLQITRLTGSAVRSFAEHVDGEDRHITVRLSPPRSDSVSTINIAYRGVPTFGTDTINGIGERWIELGLDSFWHPVFDDFSHAILAHVRLDLPRGWTPVASGTIKQNGNSFDIVSTVPLIDIAFVASPDLRHEDGERVSVYYQAGEKRDIVSKTLSTTSACAGYLNERYSTEQRPMPAVKMVIAPRGGPGYARKNYIVITHAADTSTVPLTRFVCHELAHFWSSGAISSGPENWLNEGFAEFVSARYVRATVGEDAYQTIVTQWQNRAKGQAAIWTPESKRRPTAGTSYGKAPYLLDRLEARVGKATMDLILTRYMRESIGTTSALIDMIQQVAGADAATWFRQQLSI
jgi:hypothetical protein